MSDFKSYGSRLKEDVRLCVEERNSLHEKLDEIRAIEKEAMAKRKAIFKRLEVIDEKQESARLEISRRIEDRSFWEIVP